MLGVVQLGLMGLVPGGFVLMPITLGSLPFDILFFSAGVIAKRNEWLRSMHQINPIVVLVLMAMFIVFCVAVNTVAFVGDLGVFIPKKDLSTDCDAETEDAGFDGIVGVLAASLFIVSGAGISDDWWSDSS